MTRRRKKHRPDEIVAKLRDADAMLNAGKDLAAVLQALEVSDSTLERWRVRAPPRSGGRRRDEVRGSQEAEAPRG
jgi:putative transposase